MFVVDTNVLIYAADQDSRFHAACNGKLRNWREQKMPWYLSWNICYEFLRVSTHPKVFRMPWTADAAWQFLEAVLASPSISVLCAGDRHREILSATLSELPHLAGNIVHDMHTAVLMREHGISRIVTCDSDFHRFPFVDVIDPRTT